MKKKILSLTKLLIFSILVFLIAAIISLPYLASWYFGPPKGNLGLIQRYTYSFELLRGTHSLSNPSKISGGDTLFEISPGDSVLQISDKLQSNEVIPDSHIFQVYLVWTGLDTTIQAGKYIFRSGLNPMEIAIELQDATPTQITFNVLAGWRMEEIAASLQTSGLAITPNEFIASVKSLELPSEHLPPGLSGEGFLFPGSYLVSRDTSSDELVSLFLQNFSLYMTPDLIQQYKDKNLDVYEAVILASIIEKEAIIADEKPTIASVFLNRINIGMKLDSDPTVQYAIGFIESQNTWWKNPLTLTDLSIDSPYNTYLYSGFPPGPICNPDLSSLTAVAYPAESPYFYFRALCDGSGRHSFAKTFEEHVANACE